MADQRAEVKGINRDRVTEWFVAHIDGVRPPLEFELIAGGHSNLTYKLADAAGTLYVLRRPPLGAVLANEWGCRASIAIATLTPWTRRNFARWLFEDYPRAIVLTPRRWRRGMFTGPGAFDSPQGRSGREPSALSGALVGAVAS